MRYLAVLAALAILCNVRAVIVSPNIFEEKDFDSGSLPKLEYALSIDCNAKTINQKVFTKSGEPIDSVFSYLIYHDYSTPLISSGRTDGNGNTAHVLPGNLSLMDGMFILVMEKQGYSKKEIHFDIASCFGTVQETAKPDASETVETSNEIDETTPETTEEANNEWTEMIKQGLEDVSNLAKPGYVENEDKKICIIPSLLLLITGLISGIMTLRCENYEN